MKAVLTDENKDLVLCDVPDPSPKSHEILIEIYAAALNRADLLQRQGKYPSPEGCPPWMGLEVSGKVKKMGELAQKQSSFRVGDDVCALLGGGGYAELVCAPYDMVMPMPRGLDHCEAAALPEACATSYLNLFMEGHLEPGQTVYIPAGASGLAGIAIPMAKAFGTRVITSVIDEKKTEQVRRLGADVIFDSNKVRAKDIFEHEANEGVPVSAAMDCLGGVSIGECMPYMAHGGYWILISTLDGTETEVPLRALLTRGIHLVGSMLRNKAPKAKAAILKQLVDRVWEKVESTEIRPSIYRVLPLSQAEEAHGILERGENIGKVVLKVR